MSGLADIEINGSRTVRCRVHPSLLERPAVHWTILGVPALEVVSDAAALEGPADDGGELDDADLTPLPGDLLLVSELMVHSERNLVAVTTELAITYKGDPPADLSDRDGMLKEVESLARELCHLLYDMGADVARSLVSLVRVDLDIPLETPVDALRVQLLEDDGEESTPEPEPGTP